LYFFCILKIFQNKQVLHISNKKKTLKCSTGEPILGRPNIDPEIEKAKTQA
jgi:hypothetical protein